MPSDLRGMPVIEIPDGIENQQVRFPRSKKRRIRKKWRRDWRNWGETRQPVAYECMGTLMLSPLVISELKRQGYVDAE